MLKTALVPVLYRIFTYSIGLAAKQIRSPRNNATKLSVNSYAVGRKLLFCTLKQEPTNSILTFHETQDVEL